MGTAPYSHNGSNKNKATIVLITGTSSGFGLLTSVRLAARGFIVYATMRDLQKQQPLLHKVSRRNLKVEVRPLDVTKPQTIKKVIDEIKLKHGRLDVLVNNAGFGLGGFFEDISEEEMRWQMEVNFFGVQNMCRQVVPMMREQKKGLIINVSSIAGQTATPCLGAYNASKWALEGFSESLYYEVSQFGVKVVLIEPGTYPTDIFKGNAQYAKNYNNTESPYYPFSQKLKQFVSDHIRDSKKDPEDVARLIERVIMSPNPRLRYISDFSSHARVMVSKIIPPFLYEYVFRKMVYHRK
jgi:short-subunit dehydrogenase